MNTAEILYAAEQVRPDLLEKTATALALLERLSPHHEAQLREELAEITGYTHTKLAAAAGYGPMSRFGAALGGTLIAGLAGSMATDMYDAAKRGLTKGTNFRSIMRANPELKQFDKERLNRSFDALHHYAPEFTANPLLGGSLLKSVAEVEGNEHVIIRDLINARKNLQDAKHTQYSPGKVEIDLPSAADIAAEAARRSHDLEMAKRREGHDATMRAADEKNRREQLEVEHNRRLELEEAQARSAKGLKAFEAKARLIGQVGAKRLEEVDDSGVTGVARGRAILKTLQSTGRRIDRSR
jgi:hypothetical protein